MEESENITGGRLQFPVDPGATAKGLQTDLVTGPQVPVLTLNHHGMCTYYPSQE